MIALDGPLAARLAPPPGLAARVDEAEVARLLGYPDHRIPRGPAADGAARARSWYRRHGAPWALARLAPIASLGPRSVTLDGGESFTSAVLARRLRRAGADALAVVMVSAGREVDEHSARLWRSERPDEAYFLNRFAAAAVEHLAAWTGERLRRELRRRGRGLLASYAPGRPGWTLEQMPRLGRWLEDGGARGSRFEILDSGMIWPASSLLAAFGASPDLDAADRSWRRGGCRWCALAGCGFRRPAISSADAGQAGDPASL